MFRHTNLCWDKPTEVCKMYVHALFYMRDYYYYCIVICTYLEVQVVEEVLQVGVEPQALGEEGEGLQVNLEEEVELQEEAEEGVELQVNLEEGVEPQVDQ